MSSHLSPTAGESLRDFLLRVMRERGGMNGHDIARVLDGIDGGKPSDNSVRSVRRWLAEGGTKELARKNAAKLAHGLSADFAPFVVGVARNGHATPFDLAEEVRSLAADVRNLRELTLDLRDRVEALENP